MIYTNLCEYSKNHKKVILSKNNRWLLQASKVTSQINNKHNISTNT